MLQQAVSSTAAHLTGRGGDERLVARACIALDPAAPIRYRGFGVAIDGIGPALSASMEDREMRQMISEIVVSRLAVHWVAAQGKPRAEDLRAVQLLEKLPSIIDQPAIGMGVERALYDLNPSEPCHSPLFARDYVNDIAVLINSLEIIAQRQDRPELTVDRHLAAFIAARLRRPNENLIRVVGSGHPEARALATLRLLANVQEQAGSGPAPHLSAWILSILGPAVASFHQRMRRDRIADRMQRAAQSGMLGDLVAVLDDDRERSADANDFNSALAEYRELRSQTSDYDTFMSTRADEARLLGEQIAAAFAGTMVSVVTAIFLFMKLI